MPSGTGASPWCRGSYSSAHLIFDENCASVSRGSVYTKFCKKVIDFTSLGVKAQGLEMEVYIFFNISEALSLVYKQAFTNAVFETY